jgi:hypothetical protein
MATLLHALAALVLGNFRFASFFERAHSGFSDSRARIQPSNPPRCNSLLCCGIVSLLVTCQIGKLLSEARPNGSIIYVVFLAQVQHARVVGHARADVGKQVNHEPRVFSLAIFRFL